MNTLPGLVNKNRYMCKVQKCRSNFSTIGHIELLSDLFTLPLKHRGSNKKEAFQTKPQHITDFLCFIHDKGKKHGEMSFFIYAVTLQFSN